MFKTPRPIAKLSTKRGKNLFLIIKQKYLKNLLQ